MKISIKLPVFILSGVLLLALLGSSSCSSKTYTANTRIAYKRSDYIKVYKSNSNRNGFKHDEGVRKRYTVKKKKRK